MGQRALNWPGLGELAHHTLRNDFRDIDTAEAKILLIEGTDRLLPTFPATLSRQAKRSLERLGVTVRTNARVEAVDRESVTLHSESGKERVSARTVLWGAGVTASPLGRCLADATGAIVDRQGRVVVEQDLSILDFPNLFICGDLAHFEQDGKPLPGVAPVAMQQGEYIAAAIKAKLRGREPESFRYRDRGNMAVIGRAAAVARRSGNCDFTVTSLGLPGFSFT